MFLICRYISVLLENLDRFFHEINILSDNLHIIMFIKTSNLTLSPLLTFIIPYANRLYPSETSRNSASHLDTSCLTLRQHFHQLWVTLNHKKIEALENSVDDNLFGGLRVSDIQVNELMPSSIKTCQCRVEVRYKHWYFFAHRFHY